MRRFRATALVLIGAASLLTGTAADGQNVMTGRVIGSHAGMGTSIGFGHGFIGRGGFRHGRIGKDGINRMGHDFRRHHGGRHHRFGRFGPFWPGGFGIGYGGGVADIYGGYRDSDFFAPYSGPRAANGNGRVAYDYDRGYPYDHYRGDGGGERSGYAARTPRCTIEWGWDSGERRDVPIRVCRR